MVSFILGVVASVLASLIWVTLVACNSYYKLKHISGFWFQHIPYYKGRSYSIGHLSYNRYKRAFEWNGTNYSDNGEPLSDWECVHLHEDLAAKKILSLFRGHFRKSPYSLFYGFVVINFRNTPNNKVYPTDGFFQDAQETETPQHFTLHKLEDIASTFKIKQENLTQDEYHKIVIQKFHEQNN